eukprot:1145792-Pelagomonas_calceolata.AAC.2
MKWHISCAHLGAQQISLTPRFAVRVGGQRPTSQVCRRPWAQFGSPSPALPHPVLEHLILLKQALKQSGFFYRTFPYAQELCSVLADS